VGRNRFRAGCLTHDDAVKCSFQIEDLMRILITNDDGVHHPGLLALAQALRDEAEVNILAPDRNWSASGHVKTLHRPLRVQETVLADGTPALSSDGAPSDCVALAALGLIEGGIDWVVSGINPHANVGNDVTYSGTVTAAMEAAISGLGAMAISLDSPEVPEGPLDFTPAASVAALLIRQLSGRHLPEGVLLNVNVPYGRLERMQGVVVTRQGLRVYRDALVRRQDPRGKPYYWIGGATPSGIADPGTDFWALSEGYVSITPLQLDLTARDDLASIESWGLSLQG
jgi:5'-nucleotidase